MFFGDTIQLNPESDLVHPYKLFVFFESFVCLLIVTECKNLHHKICLSH